MKVKFANRIYDVLYTKELAGCIMYAIEDEPNHIDWLVNVEVVDVAEKLELRKKKWQPKEGDKIYSPNYYFLEKRFYVMKGTVNCVDALDIDIFPTEEECQAFCDKLNIAVGKILEERRKEAEK